MANNIILNPQRGATIALTQVGTSVVNSNGQWGPTGFATYTGTITGGANNGLQGKALTISGFANAVNNGTFVVLASTATTLLLNNAFAVAETHAAAANYTTVGFPAQYGSKVENIWTNQNGDSVNVNANSGDLLVAVAIGLRQAVNFDLLHGTAPYTPSYYTNPPVGGNFPAGFLQGMNDFNPAPSISDNASTTHGSPAVVGNAWTSVMSLALADIDPGASYYSTAAALWNLDGYFPSIYVWVAENVAAGSYNVTLNSMFQPGDAGAEWSSGAQPIFDGGVNFQVFCLSGCATASAVEAHSISTGYPAETTSDPATAPSSLTLANTNGDALITIGLMKSGNTFGPSLVGGGSPVDTTPMTQISNGKLVNSEAHYSVEYGLVDPGTYNPGFSNSLGYAMLVASLAIKSS